MQKKGEHGNGHSHTAVLKPTTSVWCHIVTFDILFPNWCEFGTVNADAPLFQWYNGNSPWYSQKSFALSLSNVKMLRRVSRQHNGDDLPTWKKKNKSKKKAEFCKAPTVGKKGCTAWWGNKINTNLLAGAACRMLTRAHGLLRRRRLRRVVLRWRKWAELIVMPKFTVWRTNPHSYPEHG